MARQRDVRDFSVSRLDSGRTAQLESAADEVSDRLPDQHRVRISSFDATTGNPSAIASEAAPRGDGDVVRRALEHVTALGPVLGLTAVQAPEFVADAGVQETAARARVVHLQQRYKGIPIFEAAQAVRFRPDGTIGDTVGNTISVEDDVPVTATLTASAAVLAAARYLASEDEDAQTRQDPYGGTLSEPALDLSGWDAPVLAMVGNTPDQPTVMAGGPFGADIPVALIWFPADAGLRLSWSMTLVMPEGSGQYKVLVDGGTSEILYCRETTYTVAARGNVYHADGNARTPLDFPDDWVENDETSGNAVRAHLGVTGGTAEGELVDDKVVFDPADEHGDDQKVLNIFYFNGLAHDYFYKLGFRETDGNFQRDNRGLGGLPGDPVDARAHSGAVKGTANMGTPPDGRSPVMNMGLVVSTGRHTAFDRDVVLHEFTHGVTSRLVGGPLDEHSLESPQSQGMGEGWGDYTACVHSGKTVVGDWVVKNSRGIRGFPYDENFPDGFGDLGTGRYDGSDEHNIGEIWCAALLAINRAIGADLAVQLVVDALKLSPTNPSFLDMRDAILQAAVDANETTVRAGLWRTFARFGMGVNAHSFGAQLFGIVPDDTLPADVPADPA